MAPDAFSEGLDTGMVYSLHDLAASQPTAFQLSCKRLEQVTHLLPTGGAGDAHTEGLSTTSIRSRGLEMEFNPVNLNH